MLFVLFYPTASAQREVRVPGERPPPRPRPPAPTIPLTPQPPTPSGVRVFGDWPPSGRCDFTLPPTGRQGLPNPACNDTTSGVDVPFGMSIEICEHDGQGSAGLGKCRRFLPGMNFVGDDMNDKGTTFIVEPRMIGYMNSADFPTGIKIFIGLSGSDFGNLSASGSIGYDGTWIKEDYSIPLPSSCSAPKVVETTKNGDASWSSSTQSGRLNLHLQIKPKAPFGGNNWVGIEVLCD